MWNPVALIGYLRALGFAGLVSAGLGGVIYFYLFPHLLVGVVSAKIFILFCGLLGAGLQQALAGVFNKFISPAARYMHYYEQLLELYVLRRREIITPEKYRHLVDKLTDERFLGTPTSDTNRQLPPSPSN